MFKIRTEKLPIIKIYCPHCGTVDLEVYEWREGYYKGFSRGCFIEDKTTKVCSFCDMPYIIDIKK